MNLLVLNSSNNLFFVLCELYKSFNILSTYTTPNINQSNFSYEQFWYTLILRYEPVKVQI